MIERLTLFIPDTKDSYDGMHTYATTENPNNPNWVGRLKNIRQLFEQKEISAYMVVVVQFDMEQGIHVSTVIEHKINPLRPRITLNVQAKEAAKKVKSKMTIQDWMQADNAQVGNNFGALFQPQPVVLGAQEVQDLDQ